MSMIYLDVTSSCQPGFHTGVQRVVRGIYRELRSRMEVTPLVWSPKHDAYRHLTDEESLFLKDPFARSPSPAALVRKALISLGAWNWQRLFRHPEVVRLGGRSSARLILLVPEIFKDGRLEFLRKLSSSIKVAAVFHDAISFKHPELSGRHRIQNFENYLQTLGFFHLVISVSHESKHDLESFWRGKASACAPLVVEHLPGQFGAAREEQDPLFSARRILVVSTLETRKNHLVFLAACESLWKEGCTFAVDLVGRKAKSGGEAVVQRVQALQRNNFPIRWFPKVDDAQLCESYRRCSFTVYPSLCEGFGLPILESLWHRRPCICGSNGAIGEVAEGGGCLLVDQRRASDIAQAMRQLLQDEDLFYRKVNEAGQRTFRSWHDYGEAVCRHLNGLE